MSLDDLDPRSDRKHHYLTLRDKEKAMSGLKRRFSHEPIRHRLDKIPVGGICMGLEIFLLVRGVCAFFVVFGARFVFSVLFCDMFYSCVSVSISVSRRRKVEREMEKTRKRFKTNQHATKIHKNKKPQTNSHHEDHKRN